MAIDLVKRKASKDKYNKSEKGKAYRKSDKYKAYQKAYKKSDAYKTYEKEYRKSDKRKASQKEYQKKNLGKQAAKSKKSSLSLMNRIPKWADLKAIEQFYINCPKGYEVDHIIPLQGKNVSGLHVLSNLQYLTRSANLSKKNKFTTYVGY